MMLFLKYVQPIWYYRLSHQTNTACLLKSEWLDKFLIESCKDYISPVSQENDRMYLALNNGFIPNKEQAKLPDEIIISDNISDNYLFIRRHFGIQWYFYVLLIRIFSFNNPIREINSFIWHYKAHPASKTTPPDRSDFATFESSLLKKAPLVSVIIPTLNRYEYLNNVLKDLENQIYHPIEVLICDQSEPFRPDFYENRKLQIKVIQQDEKALWLARNRCIEASTGEYLLLFDDDSRVEPDWILQHLKCIDYFNASISAGVTDTIVGHGLSKKETYFHLSDVFDTGNAMVNRNVFLKTGLFDRQFEKQRMGDGEFGLRAFLNGYQVISNPFAKRIHLKVESGGLRQMGSWDAFRTQNWTAPRPIPSVLYLARRYFGNSSARWLLCMNIPPSVIPYHLKKIKLLRYISPVLFLLFSPLVLFQVIKSWRLSTRKLKKGPIINELKTNLSAL